MLRDEHDNPVNLGQEIGRGGEARITVIPGTAEVAKIYHKHPIPPQKGEKLRVLRSVNNAQLKTFTALPTRLLFEEQRRHLVGFAMPHATGKQPIFQLIGPKSRKQHFPDKDYRFLCAVALNAAKAFAMLHSLEIVVGDVNESGLLVGRDGRVFLIDCDSFQVRQNGKSFLCEVGVPGFTPPELQGRDLRVERTVQHDCFGLAVLVFQLLFMGRHPFVGRFTGTGDMPMERAIAELRFAFVGRPNLQMQPPPDSLRLEEVGQLSTLFERSFLTTRRTEAHEWVGALNALQSTLRRCSANTSHWFPATARDCPWCRIENSSGLLLFAFISTSAPAGSKTVSIAALWASIEAVPAYVAEPFPPPTGSFPPTIAGRQVARELRRQRVKSFCWFAGSGAGFIVMLYLNGWIGILLMVVMITLGSQASASVKNHPLKKSLKDEQRQINDQLKQLKTQWETNAKNAEFIAEKERLRAAKDELVSLPAKRSKMLRDIESAKRDLQLQQFLEKFTIADASIDGIGRGRKTTLRAYGIYTAADIRPFLKVPGFGPTYMGNLRSWRNSVESGFVFDPRKSVEKSLLLKVEQEYQNEFRRLVNTLETGSSKLRSLREIYNQREQDMKRRAVPLLTRLAQTKADLEIL